MNLPVLASIATRSILKNKLRSALTMLGIVIGVGAVILMVAIGQGAQGQIQAQIEGLGTNLIVISPGSSNQSGASGGAGSFNRLTVADVEKLEREAFLLSAVSPVVVTPTQIIGSAGNWRTAVNGVDTDYLFIRDWDVRSGRYFDESELRSMRKVAILGSTVADNLYGGEDPVGQRIQIRDVPFDVIGVLASKGQGAAGSDQDDVVLVPYTTAQTRLSGRQFIPQILASTFAPGDIPAAQDEVRTILRESHELPEFEADDFTVRNQADLIETATGTTEVMTLLLGAIAGISLLVGGIGIMNIMLVSVTERTREIGIRMAIGARGSDVLTQFLVESTLLSALGGLAGLALGALGSRLVSSLTDWSTEISVATAVVAIAFSGAIGIFFGFYPARQASELDPIEALRFE